MELPLNSDEIIDAFRRCGGIAENVVVGHGALGRGLFAVDTAKPTKLHIPEHMLVSVDDIELVDGNIQLRADAKIKPDLRQFFNWYMKHVSWGQGGKAEASDFLTEMRSLPADLQTELQSAFGLIKQFKEAEPDAAFNRFLGSRSISIEGRKFLMPVIDLTNHAPQGKAFSALTTGGGVTVTSIDAAEILVNYSIADSWEKFVVYGFASREPFSFSENFRAMTRSRSIKIEIKKIVSDHAIGANGTLEPKIVLKDGVLNVSFVLIGDQANPFAPLKLFRQCLGKHLGADADEFFERLVHLNRSKFMKLLASCEKHEGAMVNLLRKAALYQLESLNSVWLGNWAGR